MNIVFDRVEILPVTLLDEQRPVVDEMKRLSEGLGVGLGWHYLLDLSWSLRHLPDPQGKRVMDAGAGTGLMQWALAGRGAQVISVDRSSRAGLSLRFRAAYRVHGMRPQDLSPAGAILGSNIRQSAGVGAKARAALRGAGGLLRIALPKSAPGEVIIYNSDLGSLPLIEDGSLDAVVAVSALEHNSPEGLCQVVAELLRVLKPGGVLLATLGAARDQDWFHEPSHGWNYTEASLKRIFQLSPEAHSNYERFDELFVSLKNCAELRDSLAPFYFRSAENGMPWGRWDPQYQPVGVLKIKP